jgi:hypothetical protein
MSHNCLLPPLQASSTDPNMHALDAPVMNNLNLWIEWNHIRSLHHNYRTLGGDMTILLLSSVLLSKLFVGNFQRYFSADSDHEFSLILVLVLVCSLLTSVAVIGVQMGETSKLAWLIGWSARTMWAASLHFLYVLFGSVCRTFASFQHILWSSSYACWTNFHFSSKPQVRLHLCSLMRTSKGLLVSLL